MSRGNYKNGVFDLHVSFASDVTKLEIDEWRQSWEQASRLLYKATHGQMRFGTITYCLNAGCRFADAWLIGWDGRSSTSGNMATPSGQMMLKNQVRARPYVIVHEFSHYALFVKDEYDSDGKGACIPMEDAWAARACIMEWPWSSGDQIAFPEGTVTSGRIHEFCCAENHTRENAEEEVNHMSCWDLIVSRYPDLTVPSTATTFEGQPPEGITWLKAKCADQPLIGLDPRNMDDRFRAATSEALRELPGHSFRTVRKPEELESERDVQVCGTPLVLPVTRAADLAEWTDAAEGSRIRAFPVVVAGAETDPGELSELTRQTGGRLRVFESSENLRFCMQSYLAEVSAETDNGAGLCFLSDTVFAAEPPRARQGCRIPVDEHADLVSFVLSLEGDMATRFVAVDPHGTEHRATTQPTAGPGPPLVHQITIRNPVAGDWTAQLGRTAGGEERRAVFMSVIVNHHVHAEFEAHRAKDGSVRLIARGYCHRFLLTNLQVEARIMCPRPFRVTLEDRTQSDASGSYSDGNYTAIVPAGIDLRNLFVTLRSDRTTYSPYWEQLTKAQPPPVPLFSRTQRLSVTNS